VVEPNEAVDQEGEILESYITKNGINPQLCTF
jgi:hypothetical protein